MGLVWQQLTLQKLSRIDGHKDRALEETWYIEQKLALSKASMTNEHWGAAISSNFSFWFLVYVLYAAYVIKKKKVILFDGFHWVYIPIYKVTRMYYYVLV